VYKHFGGHTSSIFSLAVLSDRSLISGSSDKTIKIWNIKTGECIKTLEGINNRVRSLAVLHDGTLASGSDDETIKLWNTNWRLYPLIET